MDGECTIVGKGQILKLECLFRNTYQYKMLPLDAVLLLPRNRNASRIEIETESFCKGRKFLVVFANKPTGVYIHWKCAQSPETKTKTKTVYWIWTGVGRNIFLKMCRKDTWRIWLSNRLETKLKVTEVTCYIESTHFQQTGNVLTMYGKHWFPYEESCTRDAKPSSHFEHLENHKRNFNCWVEAGLYARWLSG